MVAMCVIKSGGKKKFSNPGVEKTSKQGTSGGVHEKNKPSVAYMGREIINLEGI